MSNAVVVDSLYESSGIFAPIQMQDVRHAQYPWFFPVSESVRPVIPDKAPSQRTTTIRDLASRKYQLNKALEITVEECYDPHEIVACYSEVEAFGRGNTEAEALHNLKIDIRNLFEELSQDDSGNLGKLPTKWLRILGTLISEV